MRKLLWMVFLAAPLAAQVSSPTIISVAVAPSGTCGAGLPNQQVTTTGTQYSCQNVVAGVGTWGAINGGSSGSGTVNAGLLGQLAYYGAAGSAVSGLPAPLSFNASSYGAKGDTKYSNTSSVTTSSPTLTCSGCAFVAADAGKIIWGGGLNQTTILSVQSPTSITLASNAIGTGSSQVVYWGSDDTTALSNAWTAANAACGAVVLNAGRYIVQGAEFNTAAPAACTSNLLFYNQPSVVGAGKAATFLMPTPNFDFSGCSGGYSSSCFLGSQYALYKGFAIYGGNYSPAGGANKILAANNSGFVTDMDLSSWCFAAPCTGSIGYKILGPSSGSFYGGVEKFGVTGIYAGSTNGQLYNFVSIFSPTALEVHDPGFITTANTLVGAVVADVGYTWNSYVDVFGPGATITINGTANLSGDLFSGTQGAAIRLNAGGTLRPMNTSFPSVSGNWMTYQSGSTFIDTAGGNTYAGTAAADPVTYQRTATASGNNITQNQVVLPSTISGSLIMVGVELVSGAPTPTGCTDSHLNAYTQQGTTLTSGSTYGTARKYALYYSNGNLSSGNDTIICTFSASAAFTQTDAIEYTGQFSNGVQSTSPFEGVYTNTGSGTSVSAGTTTSTAQAGEQIGVLLNFNTSSNWTNTGTAQNVRVAGGGNFYVLSDATLANAGTYVLTGTGSANTDWAGYWFKILPAGGGGQVVYGSSSIQGTGQTSGNWSTPAGASSGQWGTSPSVGACKGSSINQECVITVGSSTVGANPVLTITQPTAFIAPPSCAAQMVGGTATFSNFLTGTVTTTTAVFTYNGTPGASSTIDLIVKCSN